MAQIIWLPDSPFIEWLRTRAMERKTHCLYLDAKEFESQETDPERLEELRDLPAHGSNAWYESYDIAVGEARAFNEVLKHLGAEPVGWEEARQNLT